MMTPQPSLSVLDFAKLVHVEHPVTKQVGPIQLYPTQRDWLRATFDARGEDGRRRYRRSVFSHVKKSGKSTLGALSALYMLLFDQFEQNREVYSVATDLDQARLIHQQALRMLDRSPQLLAWERAGILRRYRDALELNWGPARGVFKCLASDTRGLHGVSPSCLLVDETWTQQDYSLLESVALPPTRLCPLEIHTTYAGLRAQQVSGSPLWDLFTAGEAKTDPTLFFVYEHGRTAWCGVPWITERYMTAQERALPVNRFRRLHWNEWASGDAAFLTDAEIRRALDGSVSRIEQDRVQPWVLAVDYGRSHDMTALVVARLRADGTVVIGELLVLKGSRESPVPLALVEARVLELKARFRLVRAVVDQWQMLGSIERLRRSGLRIDAVTFGPAYLNTLTTNFLSLMRSGRFKAFPHPQFEAQLGAVIVKETYYGVRIDSGTGAGVRSHDDLVIAAAMAAEAVTVRGEPGAYVTTIGLQSPVVPDFLQRLRMRKSTQLAKELAVARAKRARQIAEELGIDETDVVH